ncbi:MAG: HNH endonuclease, partial [Egibacteraceae bacterium]
ADDDLGQQNRVDSTVPCRGHLAMAWGVVSVSTMPHARPHPAPDYVVFWIDLGPTDLDNLVLLCTGCHHNVHERGWRLARGPDHRWRLHPPDRR